MITINLQAKGAQRVIEFMELVAGAPEEREIQELVGNDVAELVRHHLYERDRQPNRLGGRKTHYYRAAGDSVSHQVSGRGVTVSVTQVGIRQRLLGGVITPKTAKALTIPVSAAAHGKRAREFDDLFFLPSDKPRTAGVLVREVGEGNQLEALYVLRTSVDQRPDPTVMPDENLVVQTATRAIQDFAQSLFNN